jgi:hypothetical protein
MSNVQTSDMLMRGGLAVILLLATAKIALAASNSSCRYSVARSVHFSSSQASERLTISIGAGPCYEAELVLLVKDVHSKVLYRYTAPFKRHTATQWDDPRLADEARRVVDEMLRNAMVEAKEVPLPDPTGEIVEAGAAEVLVPLDVLRRLLRSDRPVLAHPTYYEGWQYVVFDPLERVAKVIVRYNI